MKRRIVVEGFRIIKAHQRREALRFRDSQPPTVVGLVQSA
jgi:hypothetical protein